MTTFRMGPRRTKVPVLARLPRRNWHPWSIIRRTRRTRKRQAQKDGLRAPRLKKRNKPGSRSYPLARSGPELNDAGPAGPSASFVIFRVLLPDGSELHGPSSHLSLIAREFHFWEVVGPWPAVRALDWSPEPFLHLGSQARRGSASNGGRGPAEKRPPAGRSFPRHPKKLRSHLTSSSNATSAPGLRQTATERAPSSANPRVVVIGNVVVTNLSPTFAGRVAMACKL